ncbi:unnamed protein product [Caenorhabditis nigoni]
MDYCKKSNCDVIALQETNYLVPKNVENYGYVFKYDENYSGGNKHPSVGTQGKKSDFGLAFLIKSGIPVSPVKQQHPRMAYLEFKFNDVDVMVMNMYAVTCHTNNKSEEDASAFFRYITNFIAEKRYSGIVILCGDLNAFPEHASLGLYQPYVGKHVYGSSNKHGELFVDFLESAKLFHLNSRFEKPREQKWTHKVRSCSSNTELDGFLSSRTDIVQDVDTFIDESPSDHRLIASLWSVSKEYESRRKHSEANWADYEASLDDLISLASIEMYTEFAERITSAAPTENLPICIVNNLDHISTKEIEECFKNASFVYCTLSELSVNSRVVSAAEISYSEEEEEVYSEFGRMKISGTPDKDKITANMIKNGGPEMVKAVTKLFNEILKTDGCPVPEAWRTVIFKTTQTVFPTRNLENIVLNEGACPLVHVFSNWLFGKCCKDFCSYVYCNKQLSSSNSSFEKIRMNRDTENLFTVSMLLEQYASDTPVYLLFAKFKKPMENVKVSSVLEGLKKSPIDQQIKFAFASLLTGVKGELLFNNELIECDKEIGIHLGDFASSMLLGCVIRMILDECDKMGKFQNMGLQVGDQKLRRIVWDDMIIFVGDNVDDLQTQAESIRRPGKDHNLHLDTDSMIFMANRKHGKELRVNGIQIEVAKLPIVTHQNLILVTAEKAASKKDECKEKVEGTIEEVKSEENMADPSEILKSEEKVTGASKEVKCRDGTKIEIKIRTRRTHERILQKIVEWKEGVLIKSREVALQKIVGPNGKDKESSEKLKISREEINEALKELQYETVIVHEMASWKANAETFFRESVIPMFFENCCVWNLGELSSVKKACSSFLKTLNIPTFEFNPRWYVLTEQARFLVSIKENKLLLEMLKDTEKSKTDKKAKTKTVNNVSKKEESSNQKEKNERDIRWMKQLNAAFDGFKKRLHKWYKTRDALDILQNHKNVWTQFVEYCEKRIYV